MCASSLNFADKLTTMHDERMDPIEFGGRMSKVKTTMNRTFMEITL